jgi:transcriptional regulator with XRE-family HTH domain
MHGQGIPPGAISADHFALGRAARETRARRGMTQEYVGFVCGMHRNQIGAIERGEQNPTFRTLLNLTSGLRVALSELVLVYERNIGEAGG